MVGNAAPDTGKEAGFDTQVFLFELDQKRLFKREIPVFHPLSKFPSVRRDLALIVNENVSSADILDCISNCNEQFVQDVIIFDIYRGKGVEEGYKSVALGLVIQDFSQTLTDSEIDAIVNRVLDKMSSNINAKLRG